MPGCRWQLTRLPIHSKARRALRFCSIASHKAQGKVCITHAPSHSLHTGPVSKCCINILRLIKGRVSQREIPEGSKVPVPAVNAIHFLARRHAFPPVRAGSTTTHTQGHFCYQYNHSIISTVVVLC